MGRRVGNSSGVWISNESLGEMPVRAVVYSHSHIDHFGGMHGVISEADVTSGDVQVFAPKGFMQAVASDNVCARTAISRRAIMQYGRAANMLADVFEQHGYQYESASLRNVFLAAAQELRNCNELRESTNPTPSAISLRAKLYARRPPMP